MDSHTFNYAVMLAALGMLYLATNALGYANLSLFLLYLAVALATRYPKVTIADPCLLFDMAEVFLFLTVVNIGLIWAVPFLFLSIWMIVLPGIRVETPVDSSERTVGMILGLAFFLLFLKLGFPLLVAMTVGVLVSSMVWSGLAFFVFHVTNPTFFVVALVKAVLFYRVSIQLGLF